MMATNGSTQPTCQNCSTSTTPLWRRDEFGSVLCNACGLFLKLHGRPRPISLKTDVIKSRNRVKTMRPDLAPKKKQQQQQQQQQQHQQQQAQNFSVATDHHGLDLSGHNTAAAQAARRASQRSVNGHHDGSDSPISRTGTPSMYNHSLPSFMVDDPSGFGASGNSDGRAQSPLNGERHPDAPQTHEQLIAQNSSLKTRVSELELINELFRGRLSQIEQQEAAARRGQEVAGVEQNQLRSQLKAAQDSETRLRAQLEDSHRRENSLKRRLDDLELELKEAKDAVEDASIERPAKRLRLTESTAKPEEAPKAQVDAPAPAIPAVAETSDVSEAPKTQSPSLPEATEAPKAAEAPEADESTKATESIEVAASGPA
ncbi:GATA zinc finger protein 3 [Neonectria punicea]|uniref:GATA zinc finger protein 3 n=1 Tax=Neonectria punicea TaxID=979145 RepID=A0ABR1HDA3_9HYPO